MNFRRVLTVAAIFVPAALLGLQIYIAHDEWATGREAPRILTLRSYPAIDPNIHLSMESKDVGVIFNVNGRQLDNLLVSDNSLTNAGKTRIEPEDFDRPISVKIAPPWEIVAVENSPFPSTEPQLEWQQVTPREFRAKPAIINAGEIIFFSVLVTKPTADSKSEVKPQLSWDVHGKNLSGFSPAEEGQFDRYSRAYGSADALRVELIGWTIAVAIALASIAQASYLVLLYLIGWLRLPAWKTIPLIVVLTVVSYCAAEATVTYLFDSPTSVLNGGVSNWLNAPIIAIEVLLLILLGRMAARRTRSSPP